VTWKSARTFSEKNSLGDVSVATAQTYIEKNFVSSMDFVALIVPNKQNAPGVRACGMSPHLRTSFWGGTKTKAHKGQAAVGA